MTATTLTPRINYGHISPQWATLFENPALGDRVEERNILGAQLAWTRGSYILSLYGTNLTDQHYVGAVNSAFASPACRASSACAYSGRSSEIGRRALTTGRRPSFFPGRVSHGP